MRRIAVEEAFITKEILNEYPAVLKQPDVEPGLAKMGATVFAPGAVTERLHNNLLDIGADRIKHMDEVGIDVQVISMTSPGVQVFRSSSLATTLAAASNDALSAAVKKFPKRFAGLGAIAPQDPDRAALEIERIASLGLCGLIINSHTLGEYLDLPKYRPIFESAQAARLPIYLHPREPAPSLVTPFLDYGLYFAGFGFAVETSLHAMRLIMSGICERYPKLQIILGHMGEGLPFWLQRIDNRYLSHVRLGGVEKLPRLPSEYFLENFVITTSGVTSMPALRLSLEVLGVERILFAADYPYENDADAVTFMDNATVTESERSQIYELNANRVFKLVPQRNLAQSSRDL